MVAASRARILSDVPAETIEWLLEPENPAVAALTRTQLLGESDVSAECSALWARRNEYEPVARILGEMAEDGSWDVPSRDYQKYGGSLWQVHFLGELWADGSDARVQAAAEYAFSRQTQLGGWSPMGKANVLQCLTSNVGRALARLGWARDERLRDALAYIVRDQQRLGPLVCSGGASAYGLNGYCHMLAPKLLLFLAEVPRDLWPDGADEVRDAAIAALRDKQVYLCLPKGSRDFAEIAYKAKPAEALELRAKWLAEHGPLEYAEKPGWLRFGYPLSYNSDVLEALAALAAIGEPMREEYAVAVSVVRAAADAQNRWTMRNTFNDKMRAKVERKGTPSKWLTLRALQVLDWAQR